jgi:predicted RNA-binding Zn-ribbon protein involved in translation (DUF1610 family)
MECNSCDSSIALSKNMKSDRGLTTEKSVTRCPNCGAEIELSKNDSSGNLLEKGL